MFQACYMLYALYPLTHLVLTVAPQDPSLQMKERTFGIRTYAKPQHFVTIDQVTVQLGFTRGLMNTGSRSNLPAFPLPVCLPPQAF